MSLITCPECNKEVSDRAEVCIHCGYPFKKEKNTKCIINGKEHDLAFILDQDYSILFKVRDFIQLTHCEINESKRIVEKIINDREIPKSLYVSVVAKQSNLPKCPFCNSTDIKKISGTERVVSATMFGILSKKIGKSFKCNNCGGTF